MLNFTSLSSVLLLFFLLSCGLSSCTPIPVVRGELQGQIEWQGEVHLQGDVVLAENSMLTIAPGTRVIFLPGTASSDKLKDHPYFPGSELIVRGQIVALGTFAAPIRFQFIDPAAPPVVGVG